MGRIILEILIRTLVLLMYLAHYNFVLKSEVNSVTINDIVWNGQSFRLKLTPFLLVGFLIPCFTAYFKFDYIEFSTECDRNVNIFNLYDIACFINYSFNNNYFFKYLTDILLDKWNGINSSSYEIHWQFCLSRANDSICSFSGS